jgi:Fe2+ transport system protein FeoA
VSRFDEASRLSTLSPGTRGTVRRVIGDGNGRSDRLAALGVTPGAAIEVLQTFPGVVFRCDQTELAVEPAVARSILVDVK